jgi:glucose-1-phosphate adenylyltransferase
VRVGPGAVVRESVVLTDAEIQSNAIVEHAIIEKRVLVGEGARVGAYQSVDKPVLAMVGKNSHISPDMVVDPGAMIGPDVIDSDYPSHHLSKTDYIQTKRLPYEI